MHATVPLNVKSIAEDIGHCQSNEPKHGRVEGPPALEFHQKTGRVLTAVSDEGMWFMIGEGNESRGKFYSISYLPVLNPDSGQRSVNYIDDNAYFDVALAKARCNYLNACAVADAAQAENLKLRAILTEYGVLTGE